MNKPGVRTALYNQAHVDTHMRDLCHGRVYRESPFFTNSHLVVEGERLEHGADVLYRGRTFAVIPRMHTNKKARAMYMHATRTTKSDIIQIPIYL
jgi:hypothetical protein